MGDSDAANVPRNVSPNDAMTEPRADLRHPLFARMYARMSSRAEQRGQAHQRHELLAGLSGRVLELGAGNGLNFPYYPDTVNEVVAVEPEPYLRARAAKAAARAPVGVLVIAGVADRLPSEAASFDAAVTSLVLCSVPDQQRALTELFRVVRPGGQLRFYEHVVARVPLARLAQRVADAMFWPRVGGGCHLARDTAGAIERAGFVIESYERFSFAPAPLVALPHIRGSARRP